MVGRGEIAFDGVNLLKDLVIMELRSVVKSDGFDVPAVLGDGHHGRFVGLGHRAAGQLLDHGKARLAFNQGEQAMVLVGADDRVALPVSDALASLDLFGALADVPLARLDAPVINASVALASELGDDPRVLPQRAAQELVAQDVPVDRAVADLQLPSPAQPASDLLGAPLLAQKVVHQAPVLAAEQGPAATSPSARLRVLLSLRRSVSTVISGGISGHLAADGRSTAPHLQRDRSHARATAQTRGNEVSFFSGELVIRQGCNPCLAGKRKQQYLRSPTFKNRCCTSDGNPRWITWLKIGRD